MISAGLSCHLQGLICISLQANQFCFLEISITHLHETYCTVKKVQGRCDLVIPSLRLNPAVFGLVGGPFTILSNRLPASFLRPGLNFSFPFPSLTTIENFVLKIQIPHQLPPTSRSILQPTLPHVLVVATFPCQPSACCKPTKSLNNPRSFLKLALSIHFPVCIPLHPPPSPLLYHYLPPQDQTSTTPHTILVAPAAPWSKIWASRPCVS
jgi:hypothetical protein